MRHKPDVTAFCEPHSGSLQYVVADPATGKCALIDPVLDYDDKAAKTRTTEADRLLRFIAQQGYQLEWILDTHPHADHFSAADYLRDKTGAPIAIGAGIVGVQKLSQAIYNWPGFPTDGRQWDRLFEDGETFLLGSIPVRVLHSPGHTLASITYVIGDAAFIHDTLFMPDNGTARADFPGGSARALSRSIQDTLALPAETRDASQPMPKQILHALQVNLNAGRLHEPEANGTRYLKIPLNLLDTPH